METRDKRINELLEELNKANEQLKTEKTERQRAEAETAALLKGTQAVLEYKDFAESARKIFDACKDIIGATAGYVALLTPDGSENEVLFLEAGGMPCTVDPDLPMPIRGLREVSYRTGKAVYDNDFGNSAWMDFMPDGHVQLNNVMFSPLILDEKAVGLIGLANKQGDFTDRDANLALAFGKYAAIALRNSRARELLEIHEMKLQSIVDTAADAIITIDGSQKIIYWNKASEKIFGYSEPEALNKDISIIIPERYRQRHIEGVKRVTQTGHSDLIGKTFEMSGLRRNGEEFPVELSLAKWKAKEDDYFTGIIRDITERKEAQEQIRRAKDDLEVLVQVRTSELSKAIAQMQESNNDLLRQKEISDKITKDDKIIKIALLISLSHDSFKEKLRMILDALFIFSHTSYQSKGCIFICGEKTKTLQMAACHGFSKGMASMCHNLPYAKCLCWLSSTKKVVLSSDCNEVKNTSTPEDPTGHVHYCVPIMSSTGLLGVMSIYIKAGNERNDADEELLMSIAHVLAGLIQLNNEIRILEMDRAESVTTLAAGISHEINNPLSFIKSSISTFNKYLVKIESFIRHSQISPTPESLSEKQIEAIPKDKILDMVSMMNNKINSSNRGIERIAEVVNGLKQFSHLNRAEIMDVDINKCIDETLSILITETCKVNVVTKYSELPPYSCEPRSINQCFYHILDNAIQSTKNIGNIIITTLHMCPIDEVHGEAIQIKICDDGIGMSEETLKRAFTPFFTTREVGSGKGLGLSIVAGIIKRHNGKINIESRVGKGTSVTIDLPLEQSPFLTHS